MRACGTANTATYRGPTSAGTAWSYRIWDDDCCGQSGCSPPTEDFLLRSAVVDGDVEERFLQSDTGNILVPVGRGAGGFRMMIVHL